MERHAYHVGTFKVTTTFSPHFQLSTGSDSVPYTAEAITTQRLHTVVTLEDPANFLRRWFLTDCENDAVSATLLEELIRGTLR